jgi:uncharacterized protein YlaN (UPF0358 family)
MDNPIVALKKEIDKEIERVKLQVQIDMCEFLIETLQTQVFGLKTKLDELG